MSFPVVSILYLLVASVLSLKRDSDNYPVITHEDIHQTTIANRFGILLTGMLGVDRFNDKSLSADKRVVYLYGTMSLLLSFTSLWVVETMLGTPAAFYVMLLLFCFGVSANLLDWGCTNAGTINITNRCCGEFVMWPLVGMALVVLARHCGARYAWTLIVMIFLVLAAYDYNNTKSPNSDVRLCRSLTHHAFSFLFGVMTGLSLSPVVVVLSPTTFVMMNKKKPKKGEKPLSTKRRK